MLLKGICYGNDAFPKPYVEADANDMTLAFVSSDNAAAYMAPLWGDKYTSSTASSCSPAGPNCRGDLARIVQMGAQLIRLYDWDPRNDHLPFLNECQQKGLKVLVSVSNYFLKANEGLSQMDTQIPKLIRSYSIGTDYHPAVVGIVIGNEFAGYSVDDCIRFTNRFVDIERRNFANYRSLPIGHPISFAVENGQPPCWYKWDALTQAFKRTDVGSRLFLAPQTYNRSSDLFVNWSGKNKGWVDLTYEKYQLPIWFTEIGLDRTKNDYAKFVTDQLTGCWDYSRKYPGRLIAACFFSYADKVWKQGETEGSFGAHSHAGTNCTIKYSAKDFTHWEKPAGDLNVDNLTRTPLYDAVVKAYQSR